MTNIELYTKQMSLLRTLTTVLGMTFVALSTAAIPAVGAGSVPAPLPVQRGGVPAWKMMTLTGRVINDVEGSRFVVRPANGFSYQVLAVSGEPQNLSEGDHVRSYGAWHNGVLHAENIRILREAAQTRPRGNYYVPNRTQTGVVVGQGTGNNFMIRAKNGQTALVQTSRDAIQALTPGDRVRVYGDCRNQILHASNIRILSRNQSTTNNDYFVPNRTLTGVVASSPADNKFPLRTANGRISWVQVRSKQPLQLAAGDRVRVYGDWKHLMLHAKNLRVLQRGLRAEVTDNAYPNRVLTGTVTSNPTGYPAGRMFTLRGANGYTYPVRARTVTPAGLTAGDRVRAVGTWYDGLLHATNVRMLRQGQSPKAYQEHVVVGVVTNNLKDEHFMVRTNDGTTRRVLAVWGEPMNLSIGDQVRAYGDWRKGMLHASNVRVLRSG